VARGDDGGRPPLLWFEVLGMLFVIAHFTALGAGWGKIKPEGISFKFLTSAPNTGLICLVITSVIMLNLLTRVRTKQVFRPGPAYKALLYLSAPSIAFTVASNVLRDGYERGFLGPFLILTYLFAAAVFLWVQYPGARTALRFSLIPLLGVLIYMSSSRTSIFTFFVVLFIGFNYFFFRKTNRIRFFTGILFSISVIIISLFVIHYLMSTKRHASESWIDLTRRDLVLEGAVDIWENYPITGVGFNSSPFNMLSPKYIQYWHLSPLFQIITGEEFNNTGHAHNLFVHVLASTGIIGFVCFSYLMLVILRTAWQTATGPEPGNLVFLLPFLAVLIFGLMSYPFSTGRFVLTFFQIGIVDLKKGGKD
jgi:hypothetical protein